MPDEVALDAALVARAAHSRSAPFRDPYAAKLAGARGAALAERFIAQFGDPSDWIAARVAAFDALVREVAGRGEVGQVLLFGASTRPLRVATPDVRVFEVDRPEAFEARRERGVAPEGTVEIAAWLGDPGLVGAIGASGFAPVLPALVLLEGVADRVDEAALEALLRGFAQHGHGESRVAFDYSSAGLDGEALCRRAGFRHVRRVSFDQAWLALEGAWDPQRGFRERAFVVASRNAPVVRDD